MGLLKPARQGAGAPTDDVPAMKALIAAALFALALAPLTALADEPHATEIVVSGSGSITLPPDVASVSGSIQTNSANAADAVGRNNAIYERVVAALTKLGIARADVSLAGYNVSYNPKPPKPETDVTYGYSVARDFVVKVRDIAKAGGVVDACTGAGATSIGGVNFGLNDERSAQARATVKAVDDARAKAEALAAAAHLHVSGIKSINLGGGPIYPTAKMALSAAMGQAPTQFDTSSVSVTVNVEMTFLAQP
jgi:uncharacterized protein YggE